MHSKDKPPYVINLDPAVMNIPYGANIDIRDSIKYKKVMEEYGLGPNGAIMTSLNLFATKIDQVVNLLEKRSETKQFEHCIIDTPGQIECFIWSASGSIISEALASTFPTMIAYIVDTPRNSSPATFMSNMLYACSILYKTKLPMIVVFNKTDVKKADFAKEWMTDFESFQLALRDNEELNDENGGSGYMSSLVNSMSLMLEEFYSTLDVVGCSAYTGEGFDEFLDAVDRKVDEFNEFYKSERERIIKEKQEDEKRKKEKELSTLMKDLGVSDKKEQVDVLSDTESLDDETEGLVDPDTEVPEREYTFAEDRTGEIKTGSNEGMQQRYQSAFEATAKQASSKTAEEIAKYINQGSI